MLIDVANVVRHLFVNKQVRSVLVCDWEEHLYKRQGKRNYVPKGMLNTFVITTISWRGNSSCLIAFPSMTSERPLEYA
jgi:hypothetical protein